MMRSASDGWTALYEAGDEVVGAKDSNGDTAFAIARFNSGVHVRSLEV
jgi:hypothetical protein